MSKEPLTKSILHPDKKHARMQKITTAKLHQKPRGILVLRILKFRLWKRQISGKKESICTHHKTLFSQIGTPLDPQRLAQTK